MDMFSGCTKIKLEYLGRLCSKGYSVTRITSHYKRERTILDSIIVLLNWFQLMSL